MNAASSSRKLKLRKLWGYATGEGANSITINGISNVALLSGHHSYQAGIKRFMMRQGNQRVPVYKDVDLNKHY